MTNNSKDDATLSDDDSSTPLVHPPVGMEREILGKWTVFLRNFGGIVAVLVVSFMGVFNSYTIHVSVSEHNIWPSEMSMFIMVVGPVLCSWQFMNVSKTLTTIFQGAGDLTKFRERVAGFIAPGSKDDSKPD